MLAAACGTSGPTASPPANPSPTPTATPSSAPASAGPISSADAAAVYATIEDQVVAIRGLQPKAKVDPKVLDDAGIKKLTADSFSKDNPPDIVAANERIMKALGLLPADASLTDLYVSLLGSQVAGLYDPDAKTLYVVSRSGALGVVEKSTFSHEFTHALQDQNFDLGALKLDEIGQGDRSFSRLALVEGDATLSMSYWQIQHLSQAELGQLIASANDDPSTKVLLGMPAILRESLLFPYLQGLTFVQGLQGSGGWPAVNEAFGRPPASTGADPPPGEVRRRRGARRGQPAGGSRDAARRRLEGRPRRLVRRVPARRLAQGQHRDRRRHRGGRGRRLGRRPDRPRPGPRRRLGRRPPDRLGHARRCRSVRIGGDRPRRRPGVAGVAPAGSGRQRALGRDRLR